MRRPYAYPDAYGTHATQSPRVVTIRAPAASSASTSAHTAQPCSRATARFARGRGRHERVAVDLTVRMVDRRADLAAAVLEHEHVLDLGPGEELGRCARPRGRRPCAPGRPGASTSDCVVVGREQHDLARADRGHASSCPRPRPRRGRPASPGANAGQRFANQRTSYGSGASSPPTQNGHPVAGRFGRAWRLPDDVHPLAGERIEAQLASGRSSRIWRRQPRTAGITSAAKRSSPSRSNGARIARITYARAGVDVRADLVDHLLRRCPRARRA